MASGKPSKPRKKSLASQIVQMAVRVNTVRALAQRSRISGNLIGLDLSLVNTGVIVLTEQGSLLRHNSLSFPLKRKRSDPPITEGERIERLINLTNVIVGIAKDYKVKHAAIEGYAHNKRYQAHQLGEIAGNVKVQLWLACKIIAVPVPPPTGRKHMFGYGHPSKTEILEILRSAGIAVDNDHEADAYVVAHYLFDQMAYERKGLLI